MEVERDIELLSNVGSALADSAAGAGLSAPVPSCPDWTVRDLLGHIGMVHRWAATTVGERRDGPAVAPTDEPEEGLLDWYREGHAALVNVLADAPRDLECWSFLPSPSPLKFWTRRQLHETAIHRVDAALANGETVGFETDLAADGIDELITGFLPRPVSKLHLPEDQSLALHATDADRSWRAVIGPGTPSSAELGPDDDPDAADCAVRGSASDLYLLLWNRRGWSGLRVEGDDTILDAWRTQLQVKWR